MRRRPTSSPPPVPRTQEGLPPRSSAHWRISSWSVVVLDDLALADRDDPEREDEFDFVPGRDCDLDWDLDWDRDFVLAVAMNASLSKWWQINNFHDARSPASRPATVCRSPRDVPRRSRSSCTM